MYWLGLLAVVLLSMTCIGLARRLDERDEVIAGQGRGLQRLGKENRALQASALQQAGSAGQWRDLADKRANTLQGQAKYVEWLERRCESTEDDRDNATEALEMLLVELANR